jgi:hypothetical protein
MRAGGEFGGGESKKRDEIFTLAEMKKSID